jgi:leucyl/phenylalanyl-tRNA--protein transferase
VPVELHVPRSLDRRLRRGDFRITADRAFAEVIAGCAEPRDEGGTWITGEMIAAYQRLHTAGYAHSVEAWQDDLLVGGLYGVGIGQAFFGESMYTRVPDASKAALVTLVRVFVERGVGLIDCQMKTEHLARFGAREIPRSEFLARLQALVTADASPDLWRIDTAIDPPARR